METTGILEGLYRDDIRIVEQNMETTGILEGLYTDDIRIVEQNMETTGILQGLYRDDIWTVEQNMEINMRLLGGLGIYYPTIMEHQNDCASNVAPNWGPLRDH